MNGTILQDQALLEDAEIKQYVEEYAADQVQSALMLLTNQDISVQQELRILECCIIAAGEVLEGLCCST